MADVNYTISGTVNKGALQDTFVASGITADMSVNGLYAVTLLLGTAVTQISTASLSSVGLCVCQSLATTNTHTVSMGRYSGGNLYETVTLRAGEAGILRLAAGDYAAKAAVEGSRLLVTVFEG